MLTRHMTWPWLRYTYDSISNVRQIPEKGDKMFARGDAINQALAIKSAG